MAKLNQKQLEYLQASKELSVLLKSQFGDIYNKRKSWDEQHEGTTAGKLGDPDLADEIQEKFGFTYDRIKEFYDQSMQNILNFYEGDDVTGNVQYFKYIRNLS